MAYVEKSFIGVGQIYLSADSGPLLTVGNCSELSFSFDEEKKVQKDYTNPGGGNANSLTRIDNFTGSMKLHDYTAKNLALALRGATSVESSGAVTDEAQASHGVPDELIPFDTLYDTTVTPTVTLTNATPCVENTDYALAATGIITLPGGNIDDQGVLVSYTRAPSEIMEALTTAGKEFKLQFDGLNEAQEGKGVSLICHRVKFSPAQGLNFLGGEFGEIPVEFEVLSDPSITGTDISKYMKIAYVD